MEIFDAFNHHVTHTTDFGNGSGAAHGAMGEFQFGWRPDPGGHGVTITDQFGHGTSMLHETLFGTEHRDMFGKVLSRTQQIGSQMVVSDPYGHRMMAYDPTFGNITDSIGNLQGRFR